MIWRHDPKKLEKWGTLNQNTQQTPADVARCVGVILWNCAVHDVPLCSKFAVIDVLRQLGRFVAGDRRAWHRTSFPLSSADRDMLQQELDIVCQNPWRIPRRMPGTDDDTSLIVASDACTSYGWGYVVMKRDGEVVHQVSHAWSSGGDFNGIIFLQEVAAAAWGLMATFRVSRAVHFFLIIDNTAAAHCFRRWYSSSEIACGMLRSCYSVMMEYEKSLDVVSIPGEHNVADQPSRGELSLCDTRRIQTICCVNDFEKGKGMTYAHHASRRVAHDMMEGDLIDESLGSGVLSSLNEELDMA